MAFSLADSGFGQRGSVSKMDRVQRIPTPSILVNSKNFYDTSNTAELQASIELVGLLDPVVVVRAELPSGGNGYRLISGHRRLAAYKALCETDGARYADIPAIVLDSMDDTTEELALITANATARELSYAEKLKQSERMRVLLQARKDAGLSVPKNLGTYIAEQLHTSRNEVSRMNTVSEKLIPEARERVDKGEMNAATAYAMAQKSEAEQRRLHWGEQQPETKAERQMVGGYSADQIRQDIQDRIQKENEALTQFVRTAFNGRLLSPKIATSENRNEAIRTLKAISRNSGHWSDALRYNATATGLKYWQDGEPYEATWTAIYDEMSLHALRECCRRQMQDEDEPISAPAVVEWQTGEPKAAGDYVGVIDVEGTRIRQILRYDGDGGWSFGRSYHSVEGTVIKWYPIPAE